MGTPGFPVRARPLQKGARSGAPGSIGCPFGRGGLLLFEWQGLNDDGVRAADRVGRTGTFLVFSWRDRIDEQLTGTLTDGVEMVVVVPEHLRDGIGGQQTRVMRDRAGSIEVEDLQAFLASDCQEFARRRHL